MALRNDGADVYFLSCANIHSIDVIEDLERDLGKPVVTSNQAAIWCSPRAAGIPTMSRDWAGFCASKGLRALLQPPDRRRRGQNR
jgi:maleate cis-trans isomerase